MIIPEMPEGYFILQDMSSWYILKDEGSFMKRLLDATGEQKKFEISRSGSIAVGDYAHKHAELHLAYNEVVPEEQL